MAVLVHAKLSQCEELLVAHVTAVLHLVCMRARVMEELVQFEESLAAVGLDALVHLQSI